MTVRFGLLGAGRIGKVHAKAIGSNSKAKLVAVADPMADAANAIATQYGAEVRTIDAILASSDIDAVVICTPTDTHADLIERFARAGKAIFCEKPVDLDIERVKACIRVVDETPVDYIKRSGGIFRDMTIHDFDMARFLLGEEIDAVTAQASVLVDPAIGTAGDFDSVSVMLSTASGKHATISNSRRATYGYDQRIEVHGSKGAVSAENQRPVSIEVANATGYTRPPLHDFFMTRYTEAYAREISSFIDFVESKSPASPSGTDGLIALALADAAVKSVKEGRTVKVSEITG